MIIVSQDKGKIINFDNMTRVYITFDEDDDDVCIRTETVDSLYEDLGYYKTEGRAKEILQEIALTFGISKNCPIMLDEVDLLFKKMARYEMPAE